MISQFDIQQQLEAELDPGERIAWQEQAPRFSFSPRAIFPALFALAWVAIVSFSILSSPHGRHGPSPFVFAPFIIVAVAFVAAPAARAFNARQTYYLITNRRALIVTLGSGKKVLTYYPEKLQSLERREKPDGRGDIIIDRVAGGAWNTGYRGNAYIQEVGFMNIPEVKSVEGMLRNLARKETLARA